MCCYNKISKPTPQSIPSQKSLGIVVSQSSIARAENRSLILAPPGRSMPSLTNTMLYSMNTDEQTGYPPNFPTIPTLVPSLDAPSNCSSMNSLPSTMDALDRESHENRLQLQDQITGPTGTDQAYSGQLRKYQEWWAKDQARRAALAQENGQIWELENAHPITVAKAAIFLQYETNRPKLSSDGTPIPGTRLGAPAIKQVVSALEFYRVHFQHLDMYRMCEASKTSLRTDIRIKTFEKGAQATESERLAQSQTMKACGIQSDTFTPEQVTIASMYHLEPGRGSTITQINTHTRDRAMMLLTTTMALRGDNVRRIGWSDLYMRDISLPDIGLNFKAPALIIISNQGKENSTGRIDEHGAFRHRLPEHCGIGGLAFYFFSVFHVANIGVPNFEPDYSIPTVDEIGWRKWYQHILFPGKDDYNSMTFENHAKRVNKMKKETGIEIVKVTHAGRGYTVKTARELGASVAGAMAMGNWMSTSGGSYRPCYDRALPVDAMLGAAGFNGTQQTSYFVSRGVLDPPVDLLCQIFPWIESEKTAYEARYKAQGKKAQDAALLSLLSILTWLRTVLLQDAAILYTKYPNLPIFSYKPFNSISFREFSSTAIKTIERAEEAASLRLKDLPEIMAEAMRGIITTTAMKHEAMHQKLEITHWRMDQSLDDMRTMMKASLLSNCPSKKRKALEAALDFPARRHSPSPPSSRTPIPREDVASPVPPLFSTPRPPINVVSGPAIPEPTALSPDPLASSTIISQDNIPQSPTPQSTVSLAGNIYPCSIFPLSNDPLACSKQKDAIERLETLFTYERLLRCEFEWEEKKADWLPKFKRFWTPAGNKVLTIEDVWRENHFGLEGSFSIQELNAKWEARWRRNIKSLKNEYGRRMAVITLIEKLSGKANWTTDLAFRFLHERYKAHSHSARKLADYLKPQQEQISRIMEASSSYC